MELIFSILMFMYGIWTGNGDPAVSLEQTLGAVIAANQQLAVPDSVEPPEEGKNIFVKKDPEPDAPVVKGIYVTSHSAGGARMESLLQLIDSTELNSMVIDVKDDYGYITFPTENTELLELGTIQKNIRDIGALMTRLEEHDVYPIARIVVFKDSVLAKKRPDMSFVNPDGSIWQNGRKESFVNPYLKEVWDYNIEVAKEAARIGFKEIQFDYVRFPEGFEKKADDLKYEKTDDTRVDVIAGFVKYAREQLEPLGIRISVDIFGYAASVPAAEGIGQDFVKISKYVDVICPMVYPSHYSTGWFGQKDPDKAPYETIKGAMVDTHAKLEPIGIYKPIIRPWIQDFTASWLGKGHYMKYGKAEVEAQIRALKDTGINEYLLWNAGNKYTEDVEFK
ncbi:putative glycoside hydrolase [Paenibacillus tarimensis]